jgi:hypothetical protein
MAPLSSSSLINISCNDAQSSSYPNTSLELKPRLDLWSENSSVWSLPSHKKQGKGVRFSPRKNETYEIIHISEYSQEEKKNCWFSSEEKSNMRENRKECLACLERNQDLPKEEEYEGLETSRESYFSMQRIRQAVHAVLAEQYDQKIFGLVDPEYLALRYTSYTGSSCKQFSYTGSSSCTQSLQEEASILDYSCYHSAVMA